MKIFINSLILLFSLLISLILAESIARLFFAPVDYLQPEVLIHDQLGHIVAPESGGHDAWGFRNRSVPEHSDIVAIGDSQTYGDSAISSDSWPAQLEKISGNSVYNLATGGYGPGHYLYLLQNYAVKLSPKKIIIGFYYGNDLIDSFNFKNHIQGDFSEFDKKRTQYPLRFWLSGHSVIYRIITFSGIGDMVRKAESHKKATSSALLTYNKPPIYTIFTPEKRLLALNLHEDKVTQGLDYSISYLLQISEFCKSHNLDLTIVLIPTKERVYYKHLETEKITTAYQELISNENEVDSKIKNALTDHQISFVDAYSGLSTVADSAQIYPLNDDGHPNKNGYNIIAKMILATFK